MDVDCIALDCEDGVAINRKSEARDTIRVFLESNKPPDGALDNRQRSEWSVRVNSVQSGFCTDDVKVVFSGETIPETVLLPKVNTIDNLIEFNEILKKTITKPSVPVNLIFYAESCESLINLSEICKKAVELCKNDQLLQPVGIIFGSDDFLASLGATRTEESNEVLYARQKVVLVAKAYQLQAIDMVYIDYKNLEGLKKQCIVGASMGYTGKQIIHPGQIEIVQKSFLPTPEKLHWAIGLIKAFNEHQKSGQGAFVYKNSMIDMPTMMQAQNIVKTMNSVQ